MRNIKEIIIHCSATREGQDVPVETIRDWHVNSRGWSDIGYHFYVELDGTIKIYPHEKHKRNYYTLHCYWIRTRCTS